MKSLKPAMRENKRYLLVNGRIGDVEKAVLEFIGVLGMAKTGFGWIKRERESAIISINREALNNVRASFAVWPERITVEKVSGTLRGLRGK